MAKKKDRLPFNAPGKFYVDGACLDTGHCCRLLPGVFCRHDEEGMTFVARQPVTEEELRLAVEAMETCPVNAIGNDGE
ncbi:MAG: ferredoxin [Candidatus Sumerlaeaceae bacterium]|nr:ferredoxin [Candidatus Sumerlaeaceae bacterium]